MVDTAQRSYGRLCLGVRDRMGAAMTAAFTDPSKARDAALEEAIKAISAAAKGKPQGVTGLWQAVKIVREIQMGKS